MEQNKKEVKECIAGIFQQTTDCLKVIYVPQAHFSWSHFILVYRKTSNKTVRTKKLEKLFSMFIFFALFLFCVKVLFLNLLFMVLGLFCSFVWFFVKIRKYVFGIEQKNSSGFQGSLLFSGMVLHTMEYPSDL